MRGEFSRLHAATRAGGSDDTDRGAPFRCVLRRPIAQKGRHRRFDPFSMHRSSAGRTVGEGATVASRRLSCRRAGLYFTCAKVGRRFVSTGNCSPPAAAGTLPSRKATAVGSCGLRRRAAHRWQRGHTRPAMCCSNRCPRSRKALPSRNCMLVRCRPKSSGHKPARHRSVPRRNTDRRPRSRIRRCRRWCTTRRAALRGCRCRPSNNTRVGNRSTPRTRRHRRRGQRTSIAKR
jgi:hypothetical protein